MSTVMEMLKFTAANGQVLLGEKIIVPGFERLDFIYVQDGFMGIIYELATGKQVIESQGFTPHEIYI